MNAFLALVLAKQYTDQKISPETISTQVAYEIAKIVNENNNGSIDTLNEIAEWIVNDTTGAASMANDIAELQQLVGDVAVVEQIQSALQKDGVDKYALATSLQDLATQVGALQATVSSQSNRLTSFSKSLSEYRAETDKVSQSLEKTNNKIGNLTNYWQYTDSTVDVITAINQNANWVLQNFEQSANKTNDILNNKTNTTLYPTAKGVYDLAAPHIIYDNAVGFEANDKDVGTWQITGLNLAPYARLKFYICSAGDGDTNWSPSHIVELHLDDRARGANGHFTAGHTAVCPNSTGRFHNVVVSVSADKTALAFNRSNRYSASTSATSIEGRYCYRIEGYLI